MELQADRLRKLRIRHIPAILWGGQTDRIILAVHGSHSSKADDCMWVLAEAATHHGYGVLSFDLPGHGERVYEQEPCMVQTCVEELGEVYRYVRSFCPHISVFGCSMGAYFSLLAYRDSDIRQAYFLSPVTDMERIIQNIMDSCGVDEETFRRRGKVENPMETLYWDYYRYVKEHPITRWTVPTFILRGENDILCERERVAGFASAFHCELEEQPGGEHWFHTEEELAYLRRWLSSHM